LNDGQNADCVILRDERDPYVALLRNTAGTIRAVVRGGVPVVADPDFAEWFEACGVEVVRIRLDGRPKLAATRLMRPEATAMEPGLETTHSPQ
jgi:hypothetical protein